MAYQAIVLSPNLPHSQGVLPRTTNNQSSFLSNFSSESNPSPFSLGAWFKGAREKTGKVGSPCSNFRSRTISYSKPRSQELSEKGYPSSNLQEIIKQEYPKAQIAGVQRENTIEMVEMIRKMLSSIGDGEISISAYDTAWVALIEDVNGTGAPQFPCTLQWIVKNQLPDGSWGDRYVFLAHDRIINTLACVIALKKWNINHESCEKGISFIRDNIFKLEEENAEHMLIGFEIVFPSLIEFARINLQLEVLEDSHPVILNLQAKRNLKLQRIPKEMVHKVPTTLLHSLEGMSGLSWEKLLKLQCSDGSFLFSPSSTAFALMQTKDENCLQYLNKIVTRFNGGVPNVYPVDLFEHIWIVDRLQRLGISRHFRSEIEGTLDYVYRYWTKDGICWARNSRVHDIDDTAMGFRLLRLHGYDVSSDVFQRFRKDGKFFCFAGQAGQAITGMFNLFRASQVLFPGENTMEEAKAFSSDFLTERRASNQLLDKWIITKDLPGEVSYALDVPWYASLPRIETRYYIDQYGGEDDVWIGKTLYRMPYVNNNVYLELAKSDFHSCQLLHKVEWVGIQKWFENYEFGLSEKTILEGYFLATSTIFERERSTERLAWTKTMVLIQAISSYFMKNKSLEKRKGFIDAFINKSNDSTIQRPENQMTINGWEKIRRKGDDLVDALVETLNYITMDVLLSHGTYIRHQLLSSWETWMKTWKWEEEDNHYHGGAELLMLTITLCSGKTWPEGTLSSQEYLRLACLTNKICLNLSRISEANKGERGNMMEVELDMQELVYCVVGPIAKDGVVDNEMKNVFLSVAKCFYYMAYFPQETISLHISKVLFDSLY